MRLAIPALLAVPLVLGASALYGGRGQAGDGLDSTHPLARAGVPAAGSTADTLVMPPVLANASRQPNTVEVTIVAAPVRLSVVPGTTSDAYAYNGRTPGPTLDVREGDRVIVRFRNELPEETTVHWHGLHIPWIADGSPFHPIAPGDSAVFDFVIPHGTAGTYWYHPHPHHHTRDQVVKGLYGAIIVRSDDDPLAGLTERLLILSDNRVLEDGTLDLPDRSSMQGMIDFENGREGDVMLVNGQVMPVIGVRPGGVERWRVLNASAARVFRLAIPGHTLLHVGSDGGLFDVPIEVDEILVANSERVELLVRGTGAPNSTTVLQDLPYNRYIPQVRPRDWRQTRDLLTLQYGDDAAREITTLPDRLRYVEPLDTADATVTRVFVLTQGFINGAAMDMNRIDEVASLGATEIWQIENLVGMDHPFHLHGFRFQVIDRNGVPEPYRSWKDSVNVPKHETVRFIVRLENHPGKWMYHCHILDHEQHGMMGILEVR